VPPATGIVHQVNLEYLASVVLTGANGEVVAYPTHWSAPTATRR
jgi:aconitate hydratase